MNNRATSFTQNFVFENLIKNRKSPCFEVTPQQVTVLHEPVDFYMGLHVSCPDLPAALHRSP